MKKIITYFLSIILFASCKSPSSLLNTKTNKADKIIDAAIENLGSPYKYNGTTKSGFDCSGLVYTTFEKCNIKLPRSSFEQSKIGNNLGQKTEKAQKGDLIFFKTNNSPKINHVGIVTDSKGDELKFIHSSTSQGVIISSSKEPYYQKTFIQLNRILE